MKKIGIIDYFLDEWHANHLPQWIHDESKGGYEVAFAYGKIDAPQGLSSEDWCKKFGVEHCKTIEKVIAQSDVLMVLSPDNPEMHWELCQLPLRSGKPTYVDKTFAPDYKTAEALFQLAEQYHTPMFSTSALRFTKELDGISKEGIRTLATTGPGVISNYAIHQLEMIVQLMGTKAERVMFMGTENCPQFIIQFAGNRSAVMGQYGWDCPFSVRAAKDDGTFINIPSCSEYFERFVPALLQFFDTAQPPVPEEETILISKLREFGINAVNWPGTWVHLS